MESIERKIENYAVVFNVNLVRATLNEASEFKDCLAESIADTDKDIIVNLSACEHLDSTFLGVLVSSYKKLKSQNRSLVIIEPIDQSSIFLTLNSIGKIFPLYTSVKVALEDIENKRILEKEINSIDEDKSEPVVEAEEPSMMNYQTESIKSESEEIGAELGTIPSADIQEHEEVITPQETLEVEDSGFNLFEHIEPGNGIENQTLQAVEEEPEEINNNFDTKVMNDSDVNEEETENEESEHESSPFGDNVKWEFGFSS